MSKQSGLILLLFFFTYSVQSQQSISISEADITSYKLYQQGNWKELIRYAEEVRSNGVDFFYLQARTGIAYYNLKKYRQAGEWFLRTWENDQPEWLQEYLYYSLLYSGRKLEAEKHAGVFSEQVKAKTGFSGRQITRVAFEAGYSFNPDLTELQTAPHGSQAGVGDDYGEAFFLKNYHFGSFDLSHRLSPGFNVAHSFTYIGMKKEELVEWGNRNTFPVGINQFQYFMNPYFVVGKKLYLSPSAHFIWGSYDMYLGYINQGDRDFYNTTVKYSDIVFSAAAWTHFGMMAPGFELNMADISDSSFVQTSAWLTVYPLSNLNFYFTPQVYFKNKGGSGMEYIASGVTAGAQLGPVHFTGQYLSGEMKDFIESGGYVISNFPGTSKRKLSGSLLFPAGEKAQFVVRYIIHDVSDTYRVYANLAEINSIDYQYRKHTFTAGISWNF
jgi:hypothetical protein